MPTITDVERLRHQRFRRDSGASNSSSNSNSSNSSTNSINERRRRYQNGDVEGAPNRKRPRETPSPSSSITSCSSSSSCSIPNCSRHFAYSEVLLQPQLLYELRTEEEVQSSNPLLEFCLDGGFKAPKPGSPLPHNTSPPPSLPEILRICSSDPFNQQKVEELRSLLEQQHRLSKLKGCDDHYGNEVDVRNSKGQTAMHLLIQGCTKDSFYCTLQAIYLLLSAGADPSITSSNNQESPFTSLRNLLDKDLTTEAIVLAHLIVKNQHLKGPQFVDRLVNGARGRSLLTYSSERGDSAAEMTRLLLNSGAKIWPDDNAEEDVAIRVEKEVEGSAFTWFLRALLARRGVDHEDALRQWGDETLYLLGHAAVSLPDCGPDALRDHLQRVVLRLGRSEKCEGPVFAEIRRRLAPLWAQPLSLKFLCLSKIRGAVGPGNLIRNKLDIPNTMLNYLQLG